MKERFSRSRVIIVSHSMGTIAEYCSHATVLHRGTLTEVMPLAQAEQIYNGITG
jgi:ABC-type polysaccharide/polyol phosphate transport system ATPase subunit